MCNSNFKGSYALEFMLNFYLKDQPAFYIYFINYNGKNIPTHNSNE